MKPPRAWSVYIVRCRDGSLYTGVSNDVTARVALHNAGKGARYTRSRGPVVLVFRLRVGARGQAQSREAAIKRLSRAEKEAFLARAETVRLRRLARAARKTTAQA